jgi:hypothetical protein
MDKTILIKKLKKHERSQRWLSKKLKISAMAVSKWCSGKMPIPEHRSKQILRWLP